MPEVSVLDSTMHYEEAGDGDPIVLLHGNPTSSFLWRKVIPGVAGEGRVLAPNLIGMGRSGKPDIGYRFVEHARYLDAWFDALALERVTLVGHDWGGALGFHWARRHPDRVAAVAFMETIVKPTTWSEFPEAAREMFQGFRTPGTGEQLVLEQNMFVEAVLPASMLHQLTADEMNAYREPFLERFLDATRADRLHGCWVVAAMTGLRRGELLGLRWDDVDLDGQVLSVKRSRVAAGYAVSEGTPKSGRGRTVALDPETVAVLRRHRAHQLEDRMAWGEAWIDTGLVFTR